MPPRLERMVLIGYVAAVALAVGVEAPPIPRVPLVFGFIAFCPGYAWTRLLGLEDRWLEAALAVPLSLALTLLIGTTAVYLKVWDYRVVLIAVVTLTLIPLAWGRGTTPTEREAD